MIKKVSYKKILKVFLKIVGIIVVLFILLIICITVFYKDAFYKQPPVKDPNITSVTQGTVASFGGNFDSFRIGVVNVNNSSVFLSINFPKDNSKDKKISLSLGQSVEVEDNTITVAKINTGFLGLGKGSVDLRVTTNVQKRLEDPDLLYASTSWAFFCTNGPCSSGNYFYKSGKIVEIDNSVITAEKQANKDLVNQVIKFIKDSGIMEKNCPPAQIMDAGWSYHINLEGRKWSASNTSDDCEDIFDEIDELINSAIKSIN
jgi:hypothetical protein